MARPFTFRHLLLAGAFVLIDLVGHFLGPRLQYPRPSPLQAHPALMVGTAASLLLLAFSIAVFTFLKLEPELPGRGPARGLRFGAAWAGIYLAGALQMPLLGGGSLAQEVYTALVDAGALLACLIVVGALGGRAGAAPTARPRLSAAPVALVVAFGIAGQGIADALHPAPFAAAHPGAIAAAATAAWALAIGGVYAALRSALGAVGPMRRAGRASLALVASLVPAFAFVPVFTRIDPAAFLGRVAIVLAAAVAAFLAAELGSARSAFPSAGAQAVPSPSPRAAPYSDRNGTAR